MAYRLALARGFLAEAEQDIELERWRSCVDNAQLSVENTGKAILTLFGITPKTHDPAREIGAILRTQTLPATIKEALSLMLPDLLALGTSEHFLTDYGDEATYTLPWDLFTKESAEEALVVARHSIEVAQDVIETISAWQDEQTSINNQPGIDHPA
jgi:HEPN domain-containing protein